MRERKLGPALHAQALAASTFELDGLEFVLFEFGLCSPHCACLTASENAVVALLAAGYATGQIAAARRVSYRTVANQLASIYRKLAVNSRTELLAAARAAQALERPPP